MNTPLANQKKKIIKIATNKLIYVSVFLKNSNVDILFFLNKNSTTYCAELGSVYMRGCHCLWLLIYTDNPSKISCKKILFDITINKDKKKNLYKK